ncbi:MAG: archaeal proteasome endopeptidase complex subunit alpha [Candidatus Nanoarchaeia archaeon]|nr:archaeal proteasome endopeptidase complex subunit alpha [Candidatus Nanoarchaeia archaeon]MDD5741251.1 archaeal proteasome endopeptidase complex subunit alpha [Candidatus Nanoarchaeia archaeon]
MEIPDMQHQLMGYDRSATMFSPDGHILQVEYAEKTVRLGSASIGMLCKDGVVIIADKGFKDELIVQKSAEKIYEIDEHIIASAAGILSDARILINQTRLIAQQHRVTYDSPIEVESVIREIADIQQQFTQYPGARPFGVALMIAGKNGDDFKLYTSDITGNYFEYKSVAIGENDEKIKEDLRKRHKKENTIEENIKLGFDIFKKVLGNKFDASRFNVAYVGKEGKLKRLTEKEIEKYK